MLRDDKFDFKLDTATGELDLSGGQLNLSSGVDAIAQEVMVRVKFIKGELFYDLARGVPYYAGPNVPESQALLGPRFDRAKAEAAFRTVLESVTGVSRVLLVTATFDARTRRMNASWRVNTVFGDTLSQAVTQ